MGYIHLADLPVLGDDRIGSQDSEASRLQSVEIILMGDKLSDYMSSERGRFRSHIIRFHNQVPENMVLFLQMCPWED